MRAKEKKNWFAERRSGLDLSLAALAKRCGLTRSCINAWEHFNAAPRSEFADILASAYETDFETVAIQICLLAKQVARRRQKRNSPG